jgi:Phage terminase large subunit
VPLQLPTEAEFEALSDAFEEEGYSAPRDEPSGVFYRPYRPKLNPVQSHAFDKIQQHIFNLLFGERFSGKTVVGCHALVHHCRENFNARALMIVPTGRQGEEGGAWHKLNTLVRAEWEQYGTIFTEPRQNKYKDTYIWISNKYGGWSRVVLVSMPYEGYVAPRVKGIEPTFVLVDEAQTLGTDTYFKHLVQQLGRDVHIPHQPIVYTANPAGPSHWLYDRFFIKPVDARNGKWNDNYFVLHLPISDNKHNLPPKYWDRIMDACKGDDTEYRRMILGEWVDAPTGDALFAAEWDEKIHVRGNAIKNEGLLPIPGLPIITGWDLGQAHSAVTFEQFIPEVNAIKWIIFDEAIFVDRYMPYRQLVPIILGRMEYWAQRQRHEFKYQHISDDSAFNQYRAKEGSFDVKDIQDLSEGVIRMVAAPKGPHSIATRVRLTKEKLIAADLIVSATCVKTRESFGHLESDPNNPMIPKVKSRFGHAFASFSYPFIYYAARGETSMRPQVGDVRTPKIYAAA